MKDNEFVEMPMSKLLAICSEMHQAGQSGAGDLKDDTIQEILVRHGVLISDKWKVFSVKELLEMPVDTVFIHSVWGRCRISIRADEKIKFMSFSNRGPVDFRSNTDPWDQPMKIVGS